MKYSLKWIWGLPLVLRPISMLLMMVTLQSVKSDPSVMQLVHDVIRAKRWDYLAFLSTEGSDLMTTLEIQKVLAGLIGTLSASLIFLQRLQSFSVGLQGTTVPLMAISSAGLAERNTVLHLRSPSHRTQFLVLWDPSGYAASFMTKASENGLFTSQQEWLIILPRNTTIEAFRDQLSDAHIYIDSEVTVCSYQTDGDSFDLREVWKVGEGQPLQVLLTGNWSWERGLQIFPLEDKYERRQDLQGFHLRVATIVTMPYESITKNETLQNFSEGYVVDVWHTLQEQLNFSYSATDTLFGSRQADGITWNGMVGMLQTDDADVAVAPLSITKIRSVSIDFTIPIQIVSTRIYIRRPILESTWTLYFQPFGDTLWICTPISLFICGAVLWLLNRISVGIGCIDHEISFGETFWIMFSAHVQQAAVIEPKPVSGKIVFFAGFWTGMILYTCYSAILVSILTTRQPQLPFRDFEGLLQNPEWNLGVRTNTALADSLALAPKESPMRLCWDTMVGKDPVNNLPKNNDDALSSVLKGKYAFFANKEYIIYRLQRFLPIQQAMEIVDTKKDFLKRGIGFGLQKGSPYKKLFNHVLTKMTQKGHLNRLKKKWWPNIDRDPELPYPTPGFREVFTVFIIWGSGIILSIIFCLGERYFKGLYEKKENVDDDVREYHRKPLAFQREVGGHGMADLETNGNYSATLMP